MKKITGLKWKMSKNSDNEEIVVRDADGFIIANFETDSWHEHKANKLHAEAVVLAVNNTYGAGIDPELIPEIVKALKDLSMLVSVGTEQAFSPQNIAASLVINKLEGKEPSVEWTSEDSKVAQHFGWDIFDTIGSENGRWQLQRIDEMEKFASDVEVWECVLDSAKRGSVIHMKAIEFIRRNNPEEYNRIINLKS